jgi:pimeloyl-ACP methyl ester carboxylesterase
MASLEVSGSVMRGEFIDVGGARLYYYAGGSRGAGEPVLLIHGFPTSSFLWSRVVPLVPNGHRMVVPDLFGFGRSDSAGLDTSGSALAPSGHARRLLRLLDVLGIEQAAVIGHGMGATIALEMCAVGMQRVTRLGLINPITPLSRHALTSPLLRGVVPMFRALPNRVLLTVLRRRLGRLYGDPAGREPTLDHYLRPFRDPQGGARLLAHMRVLSTSVASGEETARARFAAAAPDRPTAIIYGDRDPLLPKSAAEQITTHLGGARLYQVAGGHFSPEESPEQVAAALGDLLRWPARLASARSQ